MPRKKTYEEVKEEFETDGYTLISTEYHNAHDKLRFICPQGHHGEISWMKFRVGQRCGECYRSDSWYTIDKVRSVLSQEGYKLLSETYKNNRDKIKFECPVGHISSMRFGAFVLGERCGKCACNQRHDYEYVKNVFQQRGFTLLSTTYDNVNSKLKYCCPKGHIGETTFLNFNKGYGCQQCTHDSLRADFEMIKQFFASQRYTLQSTSYENAHSKLLCTCPEGHRCVTTWDRFSSGKRCKQCHFNRNRGSAHPRWDATKTDEDRINRRSLLAVTVWRKQVFERDNFTCQVCGEIGGSLHAHHLNAWNKFPEQRFVLSNGITLCADCHRKFHKIYGLGSNTRQQFEQWITAIHDTNTSA